jgi:hypothetical protein
VHKLYINCVNSLALREEQLPQPSLAAQDAYSTSLQLYSLSLYYGPEGRQPQVAGLLSVAAPSPGSSHHKTDLDGCSGGQRFRSSAARNCLKCATDVAPAVEEAGWGTC